MILLIVTANFLLRAVTRNYLAFAVHSATQSRDAPGQQGICENDIDDHDSNQSSSFQNFNRLLFNGWAVCVCVLRRDLICYVLMSNVYVMMLCALTF